MPTPAYKLARLGPDDRIFTIRREQERAERAETRLAIYLYSDAFGALAAMEDARCARCGHGLVSHRAGGVCTAAVYDGRVGVRQYRPCGCADCEPIP